MARADDLNSLYPEVLTIGTSIVAIIAPLPGQGAAVLKYGSGGSLQIQGQSLVPGSSIAVVGSTFATSQVYLLGTTEILNLNLQGPLQLSAIGSTVICYLLRGIV